MWRTARMMKFVNEGEIGVTLLGGDVSFAGAGTLTVQNPAQSRGLLE